MRQRFARAAEDRVQVCGHDLLPVLRGGLREGAERGEARVVDQRIQLPKPGDRVFHQALHVRLVRHVSRVDERLLRVEPRQGR